MKTSLKLLKCCRKIYIVQKYEYIYILPKVLKSHKYKSTSSLRSINLSPFTKQLNYMKATEGSAKLKKKRKRKKGGGGGGRELKHLLKCSTGYKTNKMQAAFCLFKDSFVKISAIQK